MRFVPEMVETLLEKYYFLSKRWQGYQVTFRDSSSFSNNVFESHLYMAGKNMGPFASGYRSVISKLLDTYKLF